jgi:predicted DNA-binding transcriptional regulator AlpA
MQGMLDFVAIPDKSKPTELISLKEVMRRIQRSRSTIYRWIRQGIFPKQAKKESGTTSALWFADEVAEFTGRLRNKPSGSPAPPLSVTPHLCSTTSQSAKLIVKPNKPLSSNKLRPSGNESEACFVVGPVLIGGQGAFFDPSSGKIFALIGQLPILPPSTASRSAQKHWRADEAGCGQ